MVQVLLLPSCAASRWSWWLRVKLRGHALKSLPARDQCPRGETRAGCRHTLFLSHIRGRLSRRGTQGDEEQLSFALANQQEASRPAAMSAHEEDSSALGSVGGESGPSIPSMPPAHHKKKRHHANPAAAIAARRAGHMTPGDTLCSLGGREEEEGAFISSSRDASEVRRKTRWQGAPSARR